MARGIHGLETYRASYMTGQDPVHYPKPRIIQEPKLLLTYVRNVMQSGRAETVGRVMELIREIDPLRRWVLQDLSAKPRGFISTERFKENVERARSVLTNVEAPQP